MENFLIEIKIYILFLFHKNFSDFKKSPYLFSPILSFVPHKRPFTSSIRIHLLFGVNLLFNSRITENKNFYLDFFEKFFGDFLVIFYFCHSTRFPRLILSFHVWDRF